MSLSWEHDICWEPLWPGSLAGGWFLHYQTPLRASHLRTNNVSIIYVAMQIHPVPVPRTEG